MSRQFLKMHGAGNDFVIFDGRDAPLKFTPTQLAHIGNRRTGVGCDQIIVIEKSTKADNFMRIYNADASEIGACGNATRCVAWIIMNETKKTTITLETKAGLLTCTRIGDTTIMANMGAPKFDWNEIPLAEARPDTLNLGFTMGGLSNPAAVSMGNPHMVFVVEHAASAPVAEFGPKLEHHPLFPERANVSFAEIIDRKKVKLRVWERGAGETLACGTAACATLVALHKRGLVGNRADIMLPGGTLDVNWDKATGNVLMTGDVTFVFSGEIEL